MVRTRSVQSVYWSSTGFSCGNFCPHRTRVPRTRFLIFDLDPLQIYSSHEIQRINARPLRITCVSLASFTSAVALSFQRVSVRIPHPSKSASSISTTESSDEEAAEELPSLSLSEAGEVSLSRRPCCRRFTAANVLSGSRFALFFGGESLSTAPSLAAAAAVDGGAFRRWPALPLKPIWHTS